MFKKKHLTMTKTKGLSKFPVGIEFFETKSNI